MYAYYRNQVPMYYVPTIYIYAYYMYFQISCWSLELGKGRTLTCHTRYRLLILSIYYILNHDTLIEHCLPITKSILTKNIPNILDKSKQIYLLTKFCLCPSNIWWTWKWWKLVKFLRSVLNIQLHSGWAFDVTATVGAAHSSIGRPNSIWQ